MSLQVIGNTIYQNGNIKVMEHSLGYTVTNGKRAIVTSEFPQLNAASLASMLGFQNAQKKENIFQNKFYQSLDAKIERTYDDCLNY